MNQRPVVSSNFWRGIQYALALVAPFWLLVALLVSLCFRAYYTPADALTRFRLFFCRVRKDEIREGSWMTTIKYKLLDGNKYLISAHRAYMDPEHQNCRCHVEFR